MGEKNFEIRVAGGVFNCVEYGEGDRLLICLHGFGESAGGFACLEPGLGDSYRIVAINLPYHGDTVWHNQYFTPEILLEIIISIKDRYHQNTFSLLGYSMGGRLGLCLAETLLNQPNRLNQPNQLNQLILLAPDGLKHNGWYWFVTQTRVGGRIFYYSVRHPWFFLCLLKFSHKLGFMNDNRYKFTFSRMDTEEKRNEVYRIWNCMKKMRPRRRRIKTLLLKHKLPVLLLFGKYDSVIPPSLGRKFSRGLSACTCIVLEKGHRLLTGETAVLIRENLERPL